MIPYMNLEEQVDSDFVGARRRALLRRAGRSLPPTGWQPTKGER